MVRTKQTARVFGQQAGISPPAPKSPAKAPLFAVAAPQPASQPAAFGFGQQPPQSHPTGVGFGIAQPASQPAAFGFGQQPPTKMLFNPAQLGPGVTKTHMKGGKGLGKVRGRMKKVLRDNITGITKAALRRLASRAGIVRMHGMMCEEVRHEIKTYLATVVQKATVFQEHARRKGMKVEDVIMAFESMGVSLLGYN